MNKKTENLKPGWKPGQSGNPKGKAKGTRNRMTVIVQALFEKEAEQIARAVIDKAVTGDMQACRLVIERIMPPMRERPVDLEFPDTSTPEGINEAQRVILEAVGAGQLLPGEASVLSGIVEQRRKAVETEEIIRRLEALEGEKE